MLIQQVLLNSRTIYDLRPIVCLFVCLSVVSVKGVHPMGGTNRDASQKFKGGG